MAAALALLAFLGLYALAQLDRSSSALRTAARDVGGSVAEELGFSAVEEASWRLQRAFTDPEDPLFTGLRRAILMGRTPELDLTDALEPSVLRETLGGSDLGPRTTLISQVRFRIPAVGHDSEQVVDFDCTVTLDLGGRTVYRRILERRRWGLLHVSPYKPFDRMTVAILNHSILNVLPETLRPMEDARRSLDFLTDRLRLLERWSNGMAANPREPWAGFPPPLIRSGAPPPIPAFLQDRLQELLAEERRRSGRSDTDPADPDDAGWRAWALLSRVPESAIRFRQEPFSFPDQPEAFVPRPRSSLRSDVPSPGTVIFSTRPVVRLEDLDYEVRLRDEFRPKEKALERAARELNDLLVQALVTSGTQPWDPGLLVRRITPTLARLQEAWLEGSRILNRLVDSVNAHSRIGLKSTVLGAYFARRSKRIDNLAVHLHTEDDLEKFLESYPVFNGHLDWGSSTDLPLRIPRIGGKMVISSPYPFGEDEGAEIRIEDLRTATPGHDLVLVNANRICIRAARVDAALFAQSGLSFSGRRPTIQGQVVLDTLAELDRRGPDQELTGTVAYDPTLSSGLLWERRSLDEEPRQISYRHYILALSPRDRRRFIMRSPEDVP